jgi:hypothetical protein
MKQEVLLPCLWFWSHLPLDDVSLSYLIMWPDLFSWYGAAEWGWFETIAKLRILLKTINGSTLCTLLFLFYINY